MTNETTHDDIINKEIEEEHAFMKARIKELENKSTYPFNEAFNKQLQEENQKLKELNNALSGQLSFVKSELELRLSAEIKRSKFILGEFKKTDKQRDYWRETAEKYKQALDEIEKLAKENVELLEGYHLEQANCLTISEIINQAKEYKTMNTNEPNQKEKKFIYGESKGCTAIYAVDEPSPNNNSYHEFIINYEPDSKTSELLGRINLQNGNFAEFGHNGIFTEHLLIIARDCLERFNTSKYACQENTLAINNINHALMWLNKRTTERVKRGVYGTETV